MLSGALLATLGLGCPARPSHRNPSRFAALPPAHTLLTGAVPCGESHEVAAGGQLVKRATDFRAMTVARFDKRLSRIGAGTPPINRDNCRELTSDSAEHPADWSSPRMPEILRELVQMAAADAVLVPVVSSVYRCDQGRRGWPWGEPAYQSDQGQLDCYEAELTVAAYLFDRDGTVLWKGVHRYDLDEAPDVAEMVDVLVRQAPIGDAAPLR
ncbi:MAG: hypothetical protein R3B72_28250 [Polyangiaceae bacterium]